MLGGGVAKRWNDKHVTQNGSNQAPITDAHVRASRAASNDAGQNALEAVDSLLRVSRSL